MPHALRWMSLLALAALTPSCSDDGVVTFESQLPLHVQQQARHVIGLHEDHHSILKSGALLRQLHRWLARTP